MADVFISYRNTPDRRALVERLAFILHAYRIDAWWDYDLAAGKSFRDEIARELAAARVVAPMWCSESILSEWVLSEARLGGAKLLPARFQKVVPPKEFAETHAADLIGWDGSASDPRLMEFVRRVCERLGRQAQIPVHTQRQLALMPVVAPLPEVAPVVAAALTTAAAPAHDYAFWKGEWETHRGGSDRHALKAIAEHAPPYFATQAHARIAEIEAAASPSPRPSAGRGQGEVQRQAPSSPAAAPLPNPLPVRTGRGDNAARFEAEGRIKVDAAIFSPRDSEAAQAGWLKPGAGKTEWFKDLDVGPEMVVVPAGEFTMGSANGANDEKPPHKVMIAAPFAIGRAPVTRGQFAAFVAATNRDMSGGADGWTGSGWKHDAEFSWRNPGIAQQDDHPVVCANWRDVVAYAAWLSQQTGKGYRLLSEAEWEFCCRATTTSAYNTGISITQEQANFGQYEKGTTPVGKYGANLWGLFDMHGNVRRGARTTGTKTT
jgi:hypothetical protein